LIVVASPLFDLTLLAAPLLLLVMLVPAVFEWRKPSDSGPRLIMPKSPHETFSLIPTAACPLLDIEEPHYLDVRLKPFIGQILGSLPNIDI
jgi:hypothetical protein